jgi:predicted transcriptional regulator
MDQDHGTTGQELADDRERTPEQVREQIDQTRAELGDTVAALSAKTDVKGQAKRAVSEAKQAVTSQASNIKGTVTGRKQELISSAEDSTPDSVSDAGRRVTGVVKQNSRVLAVLAAFGVGLLIGRSTAS